MAISRQPPRDLIALIGINKAKAFCSFTGSLGLLRLDNSQSTLMFSAPTLARIREWVLGQLDIHLERRSNVHC